MKLPVSLAVIVFLTLATTATAQQGRDLFADPKNLKVLPKNIASEDLSQTMRGFTRALGVRCSTCHVGEEDMSIFDYDFESDDKPMKQKARLMLEMVNTINAELVPTLDEVEKASRIEVRCVTCHRGRPQPKLIEDVLDEKLAGDGLDAAVEEYATLREQYHGTHSFDFSENSMPAYAESLANRGELDAALSFAKIGADYFPESYRAHVMLGDLYSASEQQDSALKSYERAAELNPRAAAFLAPKIDALKSIRVTPD
ncbi:MAG: c-type cytochrome [Gammaproteobacteria bacterium]|nr:c-type cytochrome [Gammaproteobacteria bacterium]